MPSLYLIRHGIAEDRENYEDDDRSRPLTDEGRKKTKQVAQRLYELGLRFDRLQSSPLVRAHQTLDIFADVFPACAVSQCSELAPNGSFEHWLSEAITWTRQHPHPARAAMGIIGHEPDLTAWAEMLIWGESKGVLVLKKAGIIGLAIPEIQPWESNSILFLSIPPKLLI
jgi:phosphohistidine phosphatase